MFSLFQAIKAGEIKHLWIYDQSRLSRNDSVSSMFRYECEKHEVILYTKDGRLDLSNPSDKLLKHLLDGIAEFDNAVRAERTRLGKLNRVTAGYWHGGPPPFGYKLEAKKLVVEKAEAKWVKKIFNGYLSGSGTLDIKKMLDSNGVAPRRCKGLWSLGSIQSLLKNTHYIGQYSFQDKKAECLIEVKCPAILDSLTWKAVQQFRAKEAARTQQKNRTKHFYLLRDLMFCGECERPIAGRIKPNKNEYLYYCPNKERVWVSEGGSKEPWKRGVGCGMFRSLNIPNTDRLVWDTVVKIHKNSSTLKEEVKRRILHEQGISYAKSGSEIKALHTKVAKLQKELLHAQEAQGSMEAKFLLGEITKKVYEFGVKITKGKIAEVEILLTNTELELKGSIENRKWVDWVKMFGEEVDSKECLTEEQKKLYLFGLIEKITVLYLSETNEHQLNIKFHLPIVNDGLKWNNPQIKSLGYKVKKGKKETAVMVKKKLKLSEQTP